MRIAALVKQVAGANGPEMEVLSRRAVAQGVELAAAVGDGTCTAITVGTASDEVLRDAIALGRSYNVICDGVLVRGDASVETFAIVLEHLGPFDLVLLGAGSDNDSAMARRLAARLELPFAGPARYLSMQALTLHVRCEQRDGFLQVKVPIPAVVSCAEQLIDPVETSAAARALVPADLIRVLNADELTR